MGLTQSPHRTLPRGERKGMRIKGSRVRIIRKVYRGVNIGDTGTLVELRQGVWSIALDKETAIDPNAKAGFLEDDFEYIEQPAPAG